MARKNNSGPKLEPVPLTLTFAMPGPLEPGASAIAYIDLSQCACLVARKFLRQGLNWGFAGMKILASTPGTFNVYTLPNSWVMSNAWHKFFGTWQRMNAKALEETESIRPRFLDFKVYADGGHHVAGYGANLLPSNGAVVATSGEWESSKLVVPFGPASPGNTTTFEFVATGPNYPGVSPVTGFNAVSLIEGYAASRGLPNVLDPNVPADADDASGSTPENWMAATQNEGTDQTTEVLDDMISENNIAPYPFENDGTAVDTMYPGGANQLTGLQWHDTTQVYSTSATTNVGITRVKGGNAPCGLLKIIWTPSEGVASIIVQVDMLPGFERGYLAEPMQDM